MTSPTVRSRLLGLVSPTVMLRTMASFVPPTTSTELISVGNLVRPSRPIRPAGTVNSISVSETCAGEEPVSPAHAKARDRAHLAERRVGHRGCLADERERRAVRVGQVGRELAEGEVRVLVAADREWREREVEVDAARRADQHLPWVREETERRTLRSCTQRCACGWSCSTSRTATRAEPRQCGCRRCQSCS